MGSINLRIDDELKARSYAALEKMGVTPSEALRLMLEYIADNERLPFKREHEKPRGSHRMMPSTGVKITTIIS
ncbi:hypothetical protein KLQUMA228M_23445 [Klebsiella quasipneumoniae subsp. quasipneumoniae]|uniref:type II toxin-antitoxin system RelB/DinJ family antitoxin n=1 Tax=Klebsiella quasipneumoniae TaxID=1463165 RepID=UPI003B243FB0